MIESVQFKNFKVLRDTTLPLAPFTLIVGPNGSGKSTALQGLQALAGREQRNYYSTVNLPSLEGLSPGVNQHIEVTIFWDGSHHGMLTRGNWDGGEMGREHGAIPTSASQRFTGIIDRVLDAKLGGIALYSLDARAIAVPVQILPSMHLQWSGLGLPGVLTLLRNRDDDRFKALNDELNRWLPEFDRIVVDLVGSNEWGLFLRTTHGGHRISASDLSHGTLIALALLTLAYLPDPPSVVCLEEPDRGLHPRLLREVKDALYRLCYPQDFGEQRDPVQVIATTHSPYFLDLFREHPEEIVIAEKDGLEARFHRLSDMEHFDEILGDDPLGEVWYSGVLGGVPARS